MRLSLFAIVLFALPLHAQPGVAVKPSVPEYARGYKPLTPEQRKYYQDISHAKHGCRLAMMAANQTLPTTFDCRDKVPLPVWDQGSCGSCYLVSTVRTATCTLILGGYGKADNSFMLASQYGMDRPRNFGGCSGGNGTEVIDWMVKNGWPAETYLDQQGVAHKDYPAYEARSGNDRTKPGAKLWMKGADWGYVNANGKPSTAEIKAGIYNFGRLNISIDAGGQFSNGMGTITALGNNIDHEINLVAYDDAKDGGAFLLENQWNTGWGNGGYRWVTYKAAAHLVDVFFVIASPLPPPPPPIPPKPPVPPDPSPPVPPTPITGDTITVNIGGKSVIYRVVPANAEVLPAGSADRLKKLEAIESILKTPVKEEEPKKTSIGFPDYKDWTLEGGLPSIVFVGAPGRTIPGVTTYVADKVGQTPFGQAKIVEVGGYRRGDGYWTGFIEVCCNGRTAAARLPVTATDAEIRRAARLP